MTPEEVDQQAETLELINGEITGRLARQADSSAKIDTKAVTLAGYAVAAASFLATQHAQALLAALAYAAFAVAALLGLSAYAVGYYREVPEPRGLFAGYLQRSKAQTLAALAAERVKAFEENAVRHQRKAGRWWFGVIALLIGVILMVISIIVHNGQHASSAGSQPRTSSAAVWAAASRPDRDVR